MRHPPIWRPRISDESDEAEVRELHAAEIALGLDDEPSKTHVKTVLYDDAEPVHFGRLGAATRTIRLVSNSMRRSFGRFQVVERRVDVAEDRVIVLEWSVVLLLMIATGVIWGLGALGYGFVVGWWLGWWAS